MAEQIRLGLERITELMGLLGNPQKSLKYVHVAGSNGKGSTCAMIESVLRCAGLKTGMFTSPCLESLSEQIQVNRQNISAQDYETAENIVKNAAVRMSDYPSPFELLTAVAIVHFTRMNCDIVIMEVGMGGATDSTNVIPAPEVAVITNIGLEHTEYLGDTLEKIAGVKAGIIKEGCTAVCYDGSKEVTDVVENVCLNRNVRLILPDFDDVAIVQSDMNGQHFIYHKAEYMIPLVGRYQVNNALLVLSCIEALNNRGYWISDKAVKEGLMNVSWPARFEVLCSKPLFILDGGHNLQCAEAIRDNIEQFLKGKKITFIMGVLRDKDYEDEVRLLMPYAREFICVTPESDRALPAEELSRLINSYGGCSRAMQSISEGVMIALSEKKEPVLAFGSLYMAGEIRRLVCHFVTDNN